MIIGFSGLANSGKDTAADFLVGRMGFVKVGLADVLKRICQDVFEFSDGQLWGPSEKRNAPDKRYFRGDRLDPSYLSARYALQRLGSEWGRDCYENIWIEYVVRIHDRLQKGDCYYDAKFGIRHFMSTSSASGKTNVTISDVRFKNELDAFKNAGAKVVRIVRPGAGLKGAAALHQSEKEQLDIPDSAFDAVIINDGTLDAFYANVLKAVGA